MAISINWTTRVITVPQADLDLVSAGLYELDVDAFRLALKDIEDGEEGMAFPVTHRHNAEVTLSGVTYARTFEIINGYTVTFQDTGTPYSVRCVGANHNIADVKTVNQVSLLIGNSAGLITVATGGSSGPSAGQIADAVRAELAGELDRIVRLHKIHGLEDGVPLVVTPSSRVAGDVEQTIGTAGDTVTVQSA